MFQEPRTRQLPIRKPHQLSYPANGNVEREASRNSIAYIHLHNIENLRSRHFKFGRRSVVAFPIEHQVSRQDTPAGNRSDMRHLGKDSCIPQKSERPR